MSITHRLIIKAQKGDLKHQKKLYKYCHALLLPLGRRYKMNECDAVASLNVAFIKILDHYSESVGISKFDAWSRRIMINQLIDDYRKAKAKRVVSTDDENTNFLLDKWSSQDEKCITELSYKELLRLIHQLSEPSRSVFNLFVIEGYPHDEIAELLGISAVNSRYHLSQAKKKLRNRINQLMTV